MAKLPSTCVSLLSVTANLSSTFWDKSPISPWIISTLSPAAVIWSFALSISDWAWSIVAFASAKPLSKLSCAAITSCSISVMWFFTSSTSLIVVLMSLMLVSISTNACVVLVANRSTVLITSRIATVCSVTTVSTLLTMSLTSIISVVMSLIATVCSVTTVSKIPTLLISPCSHSSKISKPMDPSSSGNTTSAVDSVSTEVPVICVGKYCTSPNIGR